MEAFYYVGVGIAGFAAGYYFGRAQAYGRSDLSAQSALLTNLNGHLAEMKGKFAEIEKSRTEQQKAQIKIDAEKEKRFQEYMKNSEKLFKEMNEKNRKSYEEKEKRYLFSSLAQVFC